MVNSMDKNLTVPTESGFTVDQEVYTAVRGYVVAAQNQIYSSVNIAMVHAYWNIGKQIYEVCGENDRAAYGKQLLQYLSRKLTEEFGKGFDERNLRNMRQFYLTFPNRNALRSDLSWTHYRSLMKVKDEAARNFYLEEGLNQGGVPDSWNVRSIHFTIKEYWPAKIKRVYLLKLIPWNRNRNMRKS